VNWIKSRGDVTAGLMLQRGRLQPAVDVFTHGRGEQVETLAPLQAVLEADDNPAARTARPADFPDTRRGT
jgi:hypothetical protein